MGPRRDGCAARPGPRGPGHRDRGRAPALNEDLVVTPNEFITKWRASELKERSASQEHFIDLCRLLDEPTPAEADPTGETYCFERGARRDSGGDGWADVWKRHHFAWEYKGRRAGSGTRRPGPPSGRRSPRRLRRGDRARGAEGRALPERGPAGSPADRPGARAARGFGDDQAASRGRGCCRPRRAATRFGRRGSRRACRTAGPSSTPSRSRGTHRRGRRSSTTGLRTG